MSFSSVTPKSMVNFKCLITLAASTLSRCLWHGWEGGIMGLNLHSLPELGPPPPYRVCFCICVSVCKCVFVCMCVWLTP